MRKLTVELEPGESVRVGADTVITLVQKSGRRARIEVETEYKIQHNRNPPPQRPGESGSSHLPAIQRPR